MIMNSSDYHTLEEKTARTAESFRVSFHLISVVISFVMVVLRGRCGNMIGHKHTQIWQVEVDQDQGESREVQLTCQPGRGGSVLIFTTCSPRGIHSASYDLI